MNDFLPINKKEMLERGWQDVDFVFVTGDMLTIRLLV